MNHLDTFSGIGGWALAARWMGWNTLAFVEKDKFCHKVLAKNFPGIPIHDDIFTFSGEPFRDGVDILTGSTPCQPFSAAGKRKGSNDERHLFPEFLRVVAETRPRWVVIENVYGLLSIESGQVFEDYHTSLEGEGYSVQTVCIPASAINARHRRNRLWIIAQSRCGGRNNRGDHRAERYVPADKGATSQGESERQRRKCWTSQAGPTDAHADQPGSQGRNGKKLRERAGQWTTRTSSPSPTNPANERTTGRIGVEANDAAASRCGEHSTGNCIGNDGSANGDSTSERLPDWAGGTLGQPFPVTEFERPGGREVERFVCRVFDGFPAGLDGGGLDDKQSNFKEGGTESISITEQILLNLRLYTQPSETSPRSSETFGDCDSLPSVPHEGTPGDRYMGTGQSTTETVFGLRRNILSLEAEREDMQQEGVLENTWQVVGTKAVANRVNRLKSLGNAIVPQIAYELFKAIEKVEKFENHASFNVVIEK